MPRSRRSAAVLAFAAALLLCACTAVPSGVHDSTATVVDSRPLAELDLLASPRDHVGSTTAVLASTAIEPVARQAQSLPVTVVSHDLHGDLSVRIEKADRIIGLDIAGSIGATLFGLGLADHVVGRDISTTFDGALGLPIVTTGAHSINSEAVIALRPDVIISDGTVGPIDVLLQLREAGIDVVFVHAEPSIDGIGELARQVAAALGVSAAGDLLATRMSSEIAATVAEIAAVAPSEESAKVRMLFLYLRGASGIYYLFGKESGADVLIEALGGVDVAAEIGLDGMKPMTDEALVAANPDLILVMTDGLASVGGVDGLLDAKPAIALTRAGQNERFVDMADGEILGFGPRTPAVLDALARAIYAA
jgi:iron complex transport system substrate-binding protein